jgi:hypothetical protein
VKGELMSKRAMIWIAAAIAALALAASAFALAITNDDANCHEQTVAVAKASHGRDSLTVVNPPEGSVAAGGGQRIEVTGHQAKLKGPGTLEVVCR